MLILYYFARSSVYRTQCFQTPPPLVYVLQATLVYGFMQGAMLPFDAKDVLRHVHHPRDCHPAPPDYDRDDTNEHIVRRRIAYRHRPRTENALKRPREVGRRPGTTVAATPVCEVVIVKKHDSVLLVV